MFIEKHFKNCKCVKLNIKFPHFLPMWVSQANTGKNHFNNFIDI